jgi:hypothetical protein
MQKKKLLMTFGTTYVVYMKSILIVKKISPEILMDFHVLRSPEYEKSCFWSAACLCMDVCLSIIGLYPLNDIPSSKLGALWISLQKQNGSFLKKWLQ